MDTETLDENLDKNLDKNLENNLKLELKHELKLEKARKRREYLTTYQRVKYQTDPEYRQKTIDKVLARYRRRKSNIIGIDMMSL